MHVFEFLFSTIIDFPSHNRHCSCNAQTCTSSQFEGYFPIMVCFVTSLKQRDKIVWGIPTSLSAFNVVYIQYFIL